MQYFGKYTLYTDLINIGLIFPYMHSNEVLPSPEAMYSIFFLLLFIFIPPIPSPLPPKKNRITIVFSFSSKRLTILVMKAGNSKKKLWYEFCFVR